jgi:hypothetical protein
VTLQTDPDYRSIPNGGVKRYNTDKGPTQRPTPCSLHLGDIPYQYRPLTSRIREEGYHVVLPESSIFERTPREPLAEFDIVMRYFDAYGLRLIVLEDGDITDLNDAPPVKKARSLGIS